MEINNYILNSKKRIKLIYVIIFVLFVFSLVGVTFSAWNWFSSTDQGTMVEFTLTDLGGEEDEKRISCAADGGGNITTADKSLAPTTCMDTTYAIQREIEVMPTILEDGVDIEMDAWLKINEIGEGFTNSQNLRYALTTSSSSCTSDVVSSGNFYGKTNGDTVPLLNKGYGATVSEKYYLYIWLDEAETSPTTMRQPLNLSLGGQCGAVESSRLPVLDDGMIPVKLSSDGTVKTILKSDSNWYNYENKEWANIVLVDDDSRDIYKNSTGVTVEQNDILAYYVWIPRYKYKIWNTGNTSSEQSIEIVFESKWDPISLGTQVGEYRTHPAFWWDDNSNGVVDSGEQLAGIWVGKFETSANTDSTCYTSSSITNCVSSNVSPRVLPNVSSLRNQIVSTQFETSRKFSESGNIYGLSNLTTDAHMMKNSEWGAVAYLSHSVYGINAEVRINNNNKFTTGCGASEKNSVYISTTCDISYNSESTPQSTTGNITGVFDMSGGAWEYVMSVLADSNGNPRSGYIDTENSGFNGLLSNNTPYTSGIDFPASKYYDLYTGSYELNTCNGGICYGHALSETAGWYDDYVDYVYGGYPWVLRGGYYVDGRYAGTFLSGVRHGYEDNYYSWRSVLTSNN